MWEVVIAKDGLGDDCDAYFQIIDTESKKVVVNSWLPLEAANEVVKAHNEYINAEPSTYGME
jgi:hypothetical protein